MAAGKGKGCKGADHTHCNHKDPLGNAQIAGLKPQIVLKIDYGDHNKSCADHGLGKIYHYVTGQNHKILLVLGVEFRALV